mgnify:FL=1
MNMKTDIYLKLQKKFGGKWVASSKAGNVVYGQAGSINQLFANLKKKGVEPQRTVIGYIEKYGQLSAYLSISTQKN